MLQQLNKLFDGQLCLENDGFERFGRQIALMTRNHNMKLSFLGVTEIGMASRLMMDIKASANENLK
ncbi:MAG: hypothetical protein ACYDCG_09920 [Candidatus Acidiferrales bacterium]